MSRELERLRQQSMQAIKKLKNAKQIGTMGSAQVDTHLRQVQAEYQRVTELSHNAPSFPQRLSL